VLQARRYREEIDLALQKLSLVPNAGRPRPDLAPRLRSFVVASHIVFYVPRRGGITVVRLLHASMDVERALGREQDRGDSPKLVETDRSAGRRPRFVRIAAGGRIGGRRS
jgi:toxin ParE1/3/4